MTVYVDKLPNGKQRYRVDVTWTHADGRVERIKRVSPIQTRRGAEQFERDIRKALADGTWGKRRVEAAPTLEDFRKRFFDQHVSRLKASTRDSHRASWDTYLVERFGKRTLDSIAAEDFHKFAAMLRASGRAPKTINNHLSYLRTALDAAHEWGLISSVPSVTWESVPEQSFDFLTFEELPAFLAASREKAVFGAMAIFGLNTGMRQGELIALRKRHVHKALRMVNVERSTWQGVEDGTKTHRGRKIPLNEAAEAALDALPRSGCDFVFAIDGEPLTKGLCKWPLWSICDEAGIGRRIGWHVLRHTFASHLVMRGAPLPAVQKLLGHASITMTMRYAHLAPDFLRAAIDSLTAPVPQAALVAEHAVQRPHSGHEDDESEE